MTTTPRIASSAKPVPAQQGAVVGRIVPEQVPAPEAAPAAPAAPPPPPPRKPEPTGYRLVRPKIAIEFQPDAVEVEEAPPPRVAFLTLYVILATLACFVAWASVAELDRVVAAAGKIVTTRPHVALQPLETSIIRELGVRPGDMVKKGDVLALLDPTFTGADLADLQGRYRSFQAEAQRLEAELKGVPFVLPDRPNDDELLQQSLYTRRMASYRAQVDSYEQDIKRGETAKRTAEDDIRVLTERMRIADEIVKMRAQLKEQQVGSQLNLLIATNDRLSITRDLERVRNQLQEAGLLIRSSRAKLDAFVQDWGQQVATKLVEAQRNANQIAEQLRKVELREGMVRLVAPEDAVVLSTADKTTGAVVTSAETLVTLVPLNAPVEAEVRIQPADIGFLSIGAPVRIKLDAFPYTKHGSAAGTLLSVSSDTILDPKRPDQPAFYRARVAIKSLDLKLVPDDFRLIPGMTVASEINIGKRSVLSYLTRPITGTIGDAMRDSSL